MAKFLFFILLICCPCVSNAESTSPLTIGVVQSLTGIAAEDGKTVVQSLQLAAEDLLKEGVNVRLLIEDDQTVPRNSATAFQKIASEHPDAIIAGTWDFTTNPLLPIASKDQIVLFNTSALPESISLSQAQGFGFTNGISVEAEAEPFKTYLSSHQLKSLSIVYTDNSWGETQRRIYGGLATAHHLKILDDIKSSSFDENEWRELIPRIKSKTPDLILLLLNKNDLAVFLRRATEAHVDSNFFASKNAFDAFRLEKEKGVFNKLCFTYPLQRLQTEQAFAEHYRQRFGEEPRMYADNTYDALTILVEAHAAELKKHISLRDALLETNFKGLVGTYLYRPANSLSIGTDVYPVI